MKVIRIFLASSDELHAERSHLSNLIENLNYRFEPRGFRLELVMWEFLDSSMGVLHKQEEYNAVLQQCDICMVLFWNKLGRFTKSEFDLAYKKRQEGKNHTRFMFSLKNLMFTDNNRS